MSRCSLLAHERNGRDACDNGASVREDLLMERIKRTYEEVFADADSIIEDAIEEARKLMQSNRGELQRVRGQIGELDKKIGSMTRLLVDPDIDATAKRAVSRQVGELEAERERLQNAVAQLASDANDNTARLAGAVRRISGAQSAGKRSPMCFFEAAPADDGDIR